MFRHNQPVCDTALLPSSQYLDLELLILSRAVTDVRMYIPIGKEAPVLGMEPSDTRRPLERERERERERDHWTSEVVSVLSL